MAESSSEYGRLLLAVASAKVLINDLEQHHIRNASDELKLKSFVLLCHSAVEEYLESVSVAILFECLQAFKEDGLVRQATLTACGFYAIKGADLPAANGIASFAGAFEVLATMVLERHRTSISTINGIKTSDQDAATLPLGLRVFEFDLLLSQKLSSYGDIRGGFAHKFGITTKTPRKAAEQDIDVIVKLLLPLDNALCNLKAFTYI